MPLYTEKYTFRTRSDDGVRLWVNGNLLVNRWANHTAIWDDNSRQPIDLTACKKYEITMEYYDNVGQAVAVLAWRSNRQGEQVIPQINLYPAEPPRQSTSTPTNTPLPTPTLTNTPTWNPLTPKPTTPRPTTPRPTTIRPTKTPTPTPIPTTPGATPTRTPTPCFGSDC